jgi:3-oxoadipate enol-lactonase/4-carboxymuconolactone decarboxylase
MLTLAIMIAHHRRQEFKLHLRPALRNGVTVLSSARSQHAADYAACRHREAAFRWAQRDEWDAFGRHAARS